MIGTATGGAIDVNVTNWRHAAGVVTGCEFEGVLMFLHRKPGRYPVSFGTAAGDIRRQALEAVGLYGEHP